MLSTNTPNAEDAIYAIALGLLLSLSPPLLCVLHFSLKIENSFFPFRGSLCFVLCSSHCQQRSNGGRGGVCRGLDETSFTWDPSEGLFQASAEQKMLPQASQEELGPCLLHV